MPAWTPTRATDAIAACAPPQFGANPNQRFQVIGISTRLKPALTAPIGTSPVTDLIGSVRLVVNTTTGEVAEAIEYDALGNVVSDTAPGFVPFGFAGGLIDRDTRLIRFGARDYDPLTGRWTARDPALFAAGGGNLYEYAGGDTINRADPSGRFLWFVFLGALAGYMTMPSPIEGRGASFASQAVLFTALDAALVPGVPLGARWLSQLWRAGPCASRLEVARALGAKIGAGQVGRTGRMAAISREVSALGLPQAEAAEAANAAVEALSYRTVPSVVGEDLVLLSRQPGSQMPVLMVRPDGSVYEAVADIAVEGLKVVVRNVRIK